MQIKTSDFENTKQKKSEEESSDHDYYGDTLFLV
jgi:hypothetical protein